jgi:TRAP-type C4-dicarboxylate transport system substrate-binding protein
MITKRHMLRGTMGTLSALFGLMLLGTAQAQEVALKAVNGFQEGTYFAKNFERFIKKVNEEGKGVVQINYIGGPKAIPAFDQGSALRNGVVDLANTTAAWTASLVPEGLVLNYTHMGMAELRKNGGLEQLNKLYMDKGLYYFARTGEGIPYHIYTNKKIDKADLTGQKLRIAPIFRDFFQKLGATVTTIPPGDVYTALERGVVDGYGWPLLGIFDMGWQDKTKYRVDPGFYRLELGVVFSANTWKKLSAEQRGFLEKQAAWLEGLNAEDAARDGQAELKKQEAAGIQTIKLDPTQSAAMLKVAYEAAWDGIVRSSPTHGPVLRNLMAPK